MTELEKAARMALEALESAKNGLIWYREQHPEDNSAADDEMIEDIDATFTALTQALAMEGRNSKTSVPDVSTPDKAHAFLHHHGFVNADGSLTEAYGGRSSLPAPQQATIEQIRRESFMAGYEAAEHDATVCQKPPHGWRCTRKAGHEGPCAAVETDDTALVHRGMDRLRSAQPATPERKGEPVKSVVIQCPMCADLDPDAGCRVCSLLSDRDVKEWRIAVAVAGPVPNTGLVPVRANTILAVDRLIANAVAAQAQPANTSPQVPEDTARLDWIERQHLEELTMGLAIDCEHDGQYYVCGDSNKTGYGDTLRAAIDAARKGE